MKRCAYEEIKATGSLPSPEGVALELVRLVNDPATSLAQITKTVEADPAISSKLLRLVNSPLAGATRPIVSISMAVRLLGMNTVRNIGLGFSLLSAHRDGVSEVFPFELFWKQSLARAAAARSLADHFKACAADEAFTIALLSRIGQLALATVFPKPYDSILRASQTGQGTNIEELERNAFGIGQTELAVRMLADWGVAGVFCQAVRRQDAIAAAPQPDVSRIGKLAALLHLAENVAKVLVLTPVYQEDLVAVMNTAEAAAIDSEDFKRRFDLLSKDWPQVASIFSFDAQAGPSLREVHVRATRRHRKVLVVDDDPAMLRLLGKYLGDAGYEVTTATNGFEAFRLIHSEGFQLVISDLSMPEMDGLQLCRTTRASEGAGFVYFVILTAHGNLDSLATAFDAGADDFLAKPCKKEELLARLKAGVRALASEGRIATQQLALHKANAELETINQKLQEIATTDELTGLYNRREAIHRLDECWCAGDRHGQPLAVMMLDIDHFKRCNDTHGHDAGDLVLQATARVLKQSARKGEAAFRLGGEEFLVVCPDAIVEAAAVGAERIRAAVEANRIRHHDQSLAVTISIGVAARTVDTQTPDDLLKLADRALYTAKQTGRNRVCVAGARTEITDANPSPRTPARLAGVFESSADPEGGGTILVVDDDPAARGLYCRLLQREGFQVIEARDGSEALAQANKAIPNAIVMDVEMPGMNGVECTRQLKADPVLNGRPIMLLGDDAGRRPIEDGLGAGAEEYVVKPVRHNEFVVRVQSMIRLQRSKAELLASNGIRGEQARAMTILFDLSRALSIADSMEDIVAPTVRATAELLNSRRVSLMLPDAAGEMLTIARAIGIPSELAALLRVPVGQSVAGRVFASGEPIVCNSPNDVSMSSDRYESDFFASVPLASVALSAHRRVVGVLNVTERYDRRPFTLPEIEYLDLVCNMVASALDRFQANKARERAYAAIVAGLAGLAEHRDSATGKHLERVTQFALLLAAELRLSSRYAATIDDRFIADLEQAMPLHDIGKVSVPDSILLKRGSLTEEEFTKLKRHTQVGADAIQSVIQQAPDAGFLTMARDIAHYHHERFDGSGYPAGLAGEEIPLSARIAAIADLYDALRAKRPYKEAMTHEKAIDIIRDSSGSHFDPGVVEAFMNRHGEFAELAARLADESVSHLAARVHVESRGLELAGAGP